jgi:hypothetical protein
MSKRTAVSASTLVTVALAGAIAWTTAPAANFGDWMNPGKWFGGGDRDRDYYGRGYGYGPYGYPGYGYPGWGYGGYGYPGYGYPGYGYGPYGYPGQATGGQGTTTATPPPAPQ